VSFIAWLVLIAVLMLRQLLSVACSVYQRDLVLHHVSAAAGMSAQLDVQNSLAPPVQALHMPRKIRLTRAVALVMVDIALTCAARVGIQQTSWFVSKALGAQPPAYLTCVAPFVGTIRKAALGMAAEHWVARQAAKVMGHTTPSVSVGCGSERHRAWANVLDVFLLPICHIASEACLNVPMLPLAGLAWCSVRMATCPRAASFFVRTASGRQEHVSQRLAKVEHRFGTATSPAWQHALPRCPQGALAQCSACLATARLATCFALWGSSTRHDAIQQDTWAFSTWIWLKIWSQVSSHQARE